MSVLVIGISHKTAPVALLERLALDHGGLIKLVEETASSEHVHEATVIATCNRLEVYADVDRFHGSVEEVSQLVVDRSGGSADALIPHLYVHYDDAAVSHLFRVAAGLDSMAVGEAQILGQTRDALRVGQEIGAVGPALNSLFQQALRVGKRARAESDIDRAAPSLVTAALDRIVGPGGRLDSQRVVVVGAGSMAALSVATASRRGAVDIAVVNRTSGNADRLAQEYGGRALPLSELGRAVTEADLVITCTGSSGLLVDATMAADRDAARPLAFIDLALPHDVDPAVTDLPAVSLTSLDTLADVLEGGETGAIVEVVRKIVAQEVAAFLAVRKASAVTPTVVALRSMATEVVDAEMARLVTRLPALEEHTRDEVLRTLRRVADKLLHEPTVRVKELAAETGTVSYATALAELFALDATAVEAVTRPEGL